MKIYDKKSVTVALALLIGFSIFGFIGYEWVPYFLLLFLEIIKSFTPYLIVFNLLAIIGLFVVKFPYRKSLSVILLLIVYCQCNSGTNNKREQNALPSQYTIFYNNVLYSNTNYKGLEERIKTYNPDFVALLEMDKSWRNNFNLADYPYKSSYTKHFLGMVFYSKFPIKNTKTIPLGDIRPLLENEIILPNGTININLVHLSAPYITKNIAPRNQGLRGIGEYLSAQSRRVVTLGDFNTTQFSPTFKELVKISGDPQIDLQRSNLFYTTWCHSVVPFACAGIDHVLAKGEVSLDNIQKVKSIGSDHTPLLITFSVADN